MVLDCLCWWTARLFLGSIHLDLVFHVCFHNSSYSENLKHHAGWLTGCGLSLDPLESRVGHVASVCCETSSNHPLLGLHSVRVALFFSPCGSYLFVFVFHLWMANSLFFTCFLHFKRDFNYTFSTVLMWTYEQLSKVQINAPHFQLFVTIFAFYKTFWGYGLPHPHFVGCFGISAKGMASVVKAEKEGLELVQALFGWVGFEIGYNIPTQAVRAAGKEVGLTLGGDFQ